MDCKRHRRHDHTRRSRKEYREIAQLDRDPEDSNDAVNRIWSVVLNKPEGSLPFVIQEDRMQGVLNQFMLDVVAAKPTQSGVAQLAQPAEQINEGDDRPAGVDGESN